MFLQKEGDLYFEKQKILEFGLYTEEHYILKLKFIYNLNKFLLILYISFIKS